MADGGAAAAEHLGDFRGGLALMRLVDEIEESDAHGGGLCSSEVGTVAAIVGPVSLGRVGHRTVEFYAEPIDLVEVVQVPAARPMPDASLPSGHGQPVEAFHATDVPALEPREHALASVVQRCLNLCPQGKPLAGLQRGTDPLRRGTPLAESTTDPVV